MRLTTLALLASFACIAGAEVPFSEAYAFAQKQVMTNPDGPARFALGRLAMIGYASEPATVDVTLDASTGTITFPEGSTVLVERKDAMLTDAARNYLREAVISFSRSTRYDPANALYALANAWAFENLARHWAHMEGSTFGKIVTEDDAWQSAYSEYRRSYHIADEEDRDLADDSNAPSVAVKPEAYVSSVAASHILRLGNEGKTLVTNGERERLEKHIGMTSG